MADKLTAKNHESLGGKNPQKFIDLRSDTVTRPSPGMRAAMAAAEVGDDVFGEDPTVNRLQETIAAMLGKEAALFVPSGTMSNQIAVRLHCRLGDELICEAECHIHHYEQGGAAQLSGVSTRTVAGVHGVLEVDQLKDQAHGGDNPHYAQTRLVCLENTHNRGGGRVQPYKNVEAICRWAHGLGIATHLDGARLFNAVIASGVAAPRWAEHFDTVSVCFSKGLAAPVGSALAGSKPMIEAALRHRKALGGGMRQAGVIAAGALYALENNIERLAEDHAHAQLLAAAIRNLPKVELRPAQVDTNIVVFHVAPELGTSTQVADRLRERGLLVIPFGAQALRAVTHLDVNRADIERACAILEEVIGSDATTAPTGSAAKATYA
ncbi:MAG TPA: GntG family PLP-dependent aldolase [Pirellulales bacterium]|jgi:threonine aldolase